jgi:hypothetical protein
VNDPLRGALIINAGCKNPYKVPVFINIKQGS